MNCLGQWKALSLGVVVPFYPSDSTIHHRLLWRVHGDGIVETRLKAEMSAGAAYASASSAFWASVKLRISYQD